MVAAGIAEDVKIAVAFPASTTIFLFLSFMKMPPLPPVRKNVKHREPEWDRLTVGESRLLAAPAAKALSGFMIRRGWRVVQRKDGAKIRVWRAA